MSGSPSVRKMPARPKIQLPLPGQYYPQAGMTYVPTPYGQTPIPMTPVSGQPQMIYSNKASEFVFSQFKGIKHLTKSGLSVGEKSAFWLYEKVSSWSKRWFTHIFLFVIVLLYSIGGAMIFVTVEGTHEETMHFNIRKERNETLTVIRELWNDQVLASNSDLWDGRARNELMKYEEHLYEFYKRGVTDRGQRVWTFWNAVFYCGTIYTTIDRFTMEDSYAVHRRRKEMAKRREKTPEPSSRNQLVETSEDEEEARRARMVKMADDAERDEQEKEKQEDQLREEKRKEERSLKEEKKENSGTSHEAGPRPRARETDGAGEIAPGRPVRKELMSKVDDGSSTREAKNEALKEKLQDAPSRKETADGRPTEARKEKRVKKKSKERLQERHSRSTDSSDMDESRERHVRRTKSPEGTRPRIKKPSAKPKASSGESDRKDSGDKPPREKRVATRSKVEEAEGQKEKRHSRRHSPTDDTDDDPKLKRSETFPRQSEEPTMPRSPTELKKQIIPLSNESLIHDFAKAQREYLKRERSILEPDQADLFEDAEEPSTVRRRKFSLAHTESEQEEITRSLDQSEKPATAKRSWFSWLPFFRKKVEEPKVKEEEEPPQPKEEAPAEVLPKKVTFLDFLRTLKDVVGEFKAFVAQNPRETTIMRRLGNRCVADLLLVIIYCGLGAFVFRFTEGAFETFYKCGVKRVKRDFLDSLWNYSHNLREDDWKSMARNKLMEFEEQLHTAHEAGVHSYSGQRSWTFLNAVVYCLTVITTIGYGHISPSTTTGKAITIVYAIFGIPMFLIILADFGKLFTRGIKFLWAFVRRLYYTGSCRKVRRTVPVQEVMKGVQLVYDFATFKRPSQINPEDIEEMQRQAQQSQPVLNIDANVPDTPGTPAMSAFAIDDEFNLPISVAIFILLVYIFVGATLFYLWEDWGFFESFYFVFISMSTIGFGDYVPKHPIYMMCSIIYLVFGLALTSMCINVVQVMLSDSFKQASQKIGATIGFEVVEEDGTVDPAVQPATDTADVHVTIKDSESAEKIAPKAKQEDVDL